MRDWVKQLVRERDLPDDGLLALLETNDAGMLEALRTAARAVCDARYGKVVFIRGLIEFTNFCRNDCLYCGIRRSNAGAGRWAFARLCYRAERTHTLPTNGFAGW